MAEQRANDNAPEGLTVIPVKPPTILMELIGYPGEARYVGLFYMGAKATWNDGLASCTFSYYSAYAPLTDHPAMYIHLLEADLGSDESHPTHALVCDREGNRFLVGEFEAVHRFLHEQISDEQRREAGRCYQKLFSEPAGLDELHALGMFELFARPSDETSARTMALLQQLDEQITEDLIRRYAEMMRNKDIRAFQPMEYISRLLRKNHQRA